MSMLTLKEIDEIAPLLKTLEEQEPVLSAWRYHIRKNVIKENKLIREIKDFAKEVIFFTKKSQLPKKDQIVFLMTSYSPSASGSLVPIIKHLMNYKLKPYVVISRNTKNLKFLSAVYVDLNEIIFSRFDNKFIKKTLKISKDMANEMEKRLNNSLNIDYYWIFQGLVAKEFAKKYCQEAKFILSDSDKESFRRGIFLGASKGAVLQHGFFDQKLFPIHAHYHFDWGPYFSKKAEEYGHPLNRSVSLGCPRFDAIEELKKKPKDGKFLEKYNLKSRPVVLAISGVHAYDLYPKSVEAFFESLKALIDNNISVLIRRHPAETDKMIYEKFLGEERVKKCSFAEANEDLYEIMRNCDISYSYASAASIEAMLFGLPVLWEKEGEGNPFLDILKMGGGIEASCLDITEIVEELGLNEKERKKVVENQEKFLNKAVINRGKATAKVVEYIMG